MKINIQFKHKQEIKMLRIKNLNTMQEKTNIIKLKELLKIYKEKIAMKSLKSNILGHLTKMMNKNQFMKCKHPKLRLHKSKK